MGTTGGKETMQLMDPMTYAQFSLKILGPGEMTNNEWLLIAIQNSIRLIEMIAVWLSQAGPVSFAAARQMQEVIHRSFALFQALSEVRRPFAPWGALTQEEWDSVAQPEIVKCKAELMRAIELQTQSQSSLAPLAREMVRYIAATVGNR